MKMKYDESDNALIRASRALTDRVTDFLGNAPPHSILNLEFLFSVKAFYLIVLARPQILFSLFKKNPFYMLHGTDRSSRYLMIFTSFDVTHLICGTE